MTREELLKAAEDLYRIAWLYVTPRERTELVVLWERIHAPIEEGFRDGMAQRSMAGLPGPLAGSVAGDHPLGCLADVATEARADTRA